MAGMGDNPLVGDYTKGISKGHSYFVALDRRIKREKANPKHVVSDLEMGLIRDQKLRIEQSISLIGLGDFGRHLTPKVVSPQKQIVRKMPKKQAAKLATVSMVLLLREHFCG